MLKNKNDLLLLLGLIMVIIFGTFLRFINLSSNPPGFYVDEAAIGYNSYSLLETGKDEYGQSWPLFFRSFGDYKMPLYIYLDIIPIKFLGLSIFSVRFLSALFGSLNIILIYLLTKEIFTSKKWLPLLSSIVLAFSPWGILFSRGAFESNLAFFLFTLGVYFFIFGFRRKPIFLFPASIIFVFSTYSYHSARLIIPLLFFAFAIFFFREIKSSWQRIRFPLIVSFMIFVLGEVPQWLLFSSPASQIRFQALGITQKYPLPFAFMVEFFSQYTTYFSPRNLFFTPDPDLQRSLPELSVFYSWMIIPYLLGLGSFLRRFKNFGVKLTAVLLMVSPVPAALTGDPFSSLRAQFLLLPLVLIIALGIELMFTFLKKKILQVGVFLFLSLFSLFYLYRSLFVLLANERFLSWSYGFDLLATKIYPYQKEKILIDDPGGTSYIEILFFLKYPPANYQKTADPNILINYYDQTNWSREVTFDNIQVRSVEWEKDVDERQIIIGRPLAITESQAEEHAFEKIFVIFDPRGKIIFNAFRTNPFLKRNPNLRSLL